MEERVMDGSQLEIINPGVQNSREAAPNEWKEIEQVSGGTIIQEPKTEAKRLENRQGQENDEIQQDKGQGWEIVDKEDCEAIENKEPGKSKEPDSTAVKIRKMCFRVVKIGTALGVAVSIPVVKEAIFSGLLWLSGAGIVRQMASYGVRLIPQMLGPARGVAMHLVSNIGAGDRTLMERMAAGTLAALTAVNYF